MNTKSERFLEKEELNREDSFGPRVEVIDISILNFSWVILKAGEIGVLASKEQSNSPQIEIDKWKKTGNHESTTLHKTNKKEYFSIIYLLDQTMEEIYNNRCYIRIDEETKNLLQGILKYVCKNNNIKVLLMGNYIEWQDLNLSGTVVLEYFSAIKSCSFLRSTDAN